MYGVSLVAVTTKKKGIYSIVAIPPLGGMMFLEQHNPKYKQAIKEIKKFATTGKPWLASTAQLLTAPCDVVTVISGDMVHNVTLGRTPLTGTELEDHIPYHE